MSFVRTICASLVLAAASAGGTLAQDLRQVQVPAEFPPASYKGTQYVDSQGCVFIRAGVDGMTTWVPRVSRGRELVCGQTPTAVDGATATAPLPPGVERITLDVAEADQPAAAAAPTSAAAAAAPKPRPKPVKTAAAPKPAPRAAAARQAPVVAPVIAPVAVAPAPVIAPAPVVVAPVVVAPRTAEVADPACTGASPISSRYINSASGTRSVRCGPQAVSPHSRAVTARSDATTATAATPTIGPDTRILPAHVAAARGQTSFAVPEGYRSVWDDGRLNPRRTEGNPAGWRAMKLVWTDTLPRRLVDRQTGLDVTAKAPLVYPYTDIATQEREFGKVTLGTMGGKTVKKIERNPGAPSAAQRDARAKPQSAPKPVVAKAAAGTGAPKGETLTGKRYVQVATFGVEANAQATAQRLQRSGLPVRIGKMTRGGETYRLVLAGPFGDAASAEQALRTARKAGFADAYIRK